MKNFQFVSQVLWDPPGLAEVRVASPLCSLWSHHSFPVSSAPWAYLWKPLGAFEFLIFYFCNEPEKIGWAPLWLLWKELQIS